MAQFDSYQAQDLIEKSIGFTLQENREDLIALLIQNGVQVPNNVSDDDLLTMVYVAIGQSNQFKKDLARYIEAQSRGESTLNYVDDEFFNANGKKNKPKVKPSEKKKLRITDTNPEGKSKAGLLLGQIGTKENIQAAINTGLGVLTQKLTSKADQRTIEDATDLSVQKSKEAAALAEAEDKKRQRQEATKKWVVPVVIGVVVVAAVVGFIIYKRRKAQ
jgi:hypothetical protein